MPGYAGNGQAKLLNTNSQAMLFSGETLNTVPAASVAFQLSRPTSMYYPWGASFEIWFSGNPGAFEVDVQTADIDADMHYCTISALNSGAALNANYVGRIELPNFWAKFVRVYVKTLTNSVLVYAMVTR